MRVTRAQLAAWQQQPPPLSVHVPSAAERYTTLELPYPPSVNAYWRAYAQRTRRGKVLVRTILSRTGREYRALAVGLIRCYRLPRWDGPVALEIALHPPDRRRRDIDNALKSLLDVMTAGHVYVDDYQVEHLTLTRRECRPGGLAVVRVERRGA